MKLFCPHGHLLCEFELSSTGEVELNELCGYTINIINQNEIHLLGCRFCEAGSNDQDETCGKDTLRDSFILVSYLPDNPIFTRKRVNDEYCRFFGVAAEVVQGRSCLESTPLNKRQSVRQKLSSCLQKNVLSVSVEKNLKADGSSALIRWIDIPVTGNTGNIVEMLAIGSPMTDLLKDCGRRKPDQQ